MVGIYGIKNKINDKWYIGQSRNIKKRFSAHKYSAYKVNSKTQNYPLYRSIRKFGLDNFDFIILEECSIKELDEKEIFWIKEKNSIKHGYNLSSGGKSGIHPAIINNKILKNIINFLKNTNYSTEEIGKLNGISGRMVRDINSGVSFFNESFDYPIRKPHSKTIHCCRDCGKEISYKSTFCKKCAAQYRIKEINNKPRLTNEIIPSSQEIFNKLKETNGNFTAVAKFYEVTANTIKKWCKKHSIPFYSKDYKENANSINSLTVGKIINSLNETKSLSETSKALNVSDDRIRTFLKNHGIDYKEYIFPVNAKPVLCVETNERFPSAKAAAESLGIKKNSHIVECCNGKHKTAYGYHWKYI